MVACLKWDKAAVLWVCASICASCAISQSNTLCIMHNEPAAYDLHTGFTRLAVYLARTFVAVLAEQVDGVIVLS